MALLPLLLLVSSSLGGALRMSADHVARGETREMCKNVTRTAAQYGTGTMKSPNKLKAVMNLIEEVSTNGIVGDIVEAGVAWGGGVLPLVFYLACTGDLGNRTVYLFDTWAGLPESTDAHDAGFEAGDYLAEWDVFLETKTYYRKEYLKHVVTDTKMRQTAFPDWEQAWRHVMPVKGLFADTMPISLSGRQLALLMCDGDMYSSTLDCMVSAGFCRKPRCQGRGDLQ